MRGAEGSHRTFLSLLEWGGPATTHSGEVTKLWGEHALLPRESQERTAQERSTENPLQGYRDGDCEGQQKEGWDVAFPSKLGFLLPPEDTTPSRV